MTAAVLRYDPPLDAPGPQGSDKKGCTGIALGIVLVLVALLAVPVKAAKRPDPGRCPRCGRSYWDCACDEEPGE